MNDLHIIPIQKQTVDLRTGKVTKTEMVNAQILPAPGGTCPECATVHEPELPHNAQSIYYQYTFYGREGRWPTWVDAMAHCPEQVKVFWTKELAARGIPLNGKGDTE